MLASLSLAPVEVKPCTLLLAGRAQDLVECQGQDYGLGNRVMGLNSRLCRRPGPDGFSRSPAQFSTGTKIVSPIQGFKFTVCVLNKNEPTLTRLICTIFHVDVPIPIHESNRE
jgi:hypothetical protein